jgi:hypothetical protein
MNLRERFLTEEFLSYEAECRRLARLARSVDDFAGIPTASQNRRAMAAGSTSATGAYIRKIHISLAATFLVGLALLPQQAFATIHQQTISHESALAFCKHHGGGDNCSFCHRNHCHKIYCSAGSSSCQNTVISNRVISHRRPQYAGSPPLDGNTPPQMSDGGILGDNTGFSSNRPAAAGFPVGGGATPAAGRVQ